MDAVPPLPDSRLARLHEPHVRPLMSLIEAWRGNGQNVPNVDPQDGGVRAKVLCLLESPGPRSVVEGGTGFISRDNPDPSARNMTKFLADAGLDRGDTLLWNAVPYCVSSATKNRNASPAQIREAAPYTQAFIDLLPELRVVVFCGRRAQLAIPHLHIRVPILTTYHPALRPYRQPRCREHLHATMAEAHAMLEPGSRPGAVAVTGAEAK